MKKRIKKLTKRSSLIFVSFFAAFILAGCATKTPDPLAGWQFSSLDNFDSIKAIKDDYGDCLQSLSIKERNSQSPIMFFQDETGRHAIKFLTGQNGTYKAHILIYDKSNRRIKVIKYKGGHYSS